MDWGKGPNRPSQPGFPRPEEQKGQDIEAPAQSGRPSADSIGDDRTIPHSDPPEEVPLENLPKLESIREELVDLLNRLEEACQSFDQREAAHVQPYIKGIETALSQIRAAISDIRIEAKAKLIRAATPEGNIIRALNDQLEEAEVKLTNAKKWQEELEKARAAILESESKVSQLQQQSAPYLMELIEKKERKIGTWQLIAAIAASTAAAIATLCIGSPSLTAAIHNRTVKELTTVLDGDSPDDSSPKTPSSDSGSDSPKPKTAPKATSATSATATPTAAPPASSNSESEENDGGSPEEIEQEEVAEPEETSQEQEADSEETEPEKEPQTQEEWNAKFQKLIDQYEIKATDDDFSGKTAGKKLRKNPLMEVMSLEMTVKRDPETKELTAVEKKWINRTSKAYLSPKNIHGEKDMWTVVAVKIRNPNSKIITGGLEPIAKVQDRYDESVFYYLYQWDQECLKRQGTIKKTSKSKKKSSINAAGNIHIQGARKPDGTHEKLAPYFLSLQNIDCRPVTEKPEAEETGEAGATGE